MSVSTTDPRVLADALLGEAEAFPRAFRAALYQMGFKGVELADPLTPVAPIYGGTLVNSYYVTPPTTTGNGDALVEFGPGTVYARRRHYEGPRAGGRGVVRYLQVAKDKLEGVFLPGMATLTRRNAKAGVGVGSIPARYHQSAEAARAWSDSEMAKRGGQS
jgi:hypothetical protein